MATVVGVGSDLPNLKVTLPNDDGKPVEVSEEMEIDNSVDVIGQQASHDEQIENHRQFISPPENLKKYENKGAGFVTGLDLFSETVSKKLEERAARFGVENCCGKSISQADVNALYESLGINIETLPEQAELRNIRLTAVHMRGVDDMSTTDVLAYFKEYGPSTVEWIDDSSCNVLWLDETGPVRALLHLSKVLESPEKPDAESHEKPDAESHEKPDVESHEKPDVESHEKPEASAETLDNLKSAVDEGENASFNDTPEFDEVVLISESSESEEEEISFKHQKRDTEAVDNMAVDSVEMKASNSQEQNISLGIPVPPGHWRLGVSDPKAKAILLRFATPDDRKLPGSEKRSQYYQKYGNPNYGGMKGLISTTRKRKIFAIKKMIDVEHLTKSTSPEATLKCDDAMNYVPESWKQKNVRMRMYADEEEERLLQRNGKRQKITMTRSNNEKWKRSVHDRLGNPGRRFVVKPKEEYTEDEDLEENYNIRSTVFKPNSNQEVSSRFNVWTSLAESMAQDSDEQDVEIPVRRQDLDEQDVKIPVRRRVIDNTHSFARASQDLQRGHYSSSPSTNAFPEGDLRSKLDKMREPAHVKKHRSPLFQ